MGSWLMQDEDYLLVSKGREPLEERIFLDSAAAPSRGQAVDFQEGQIVVHSHHRKE